MAQLVLLVVAAAWAAVLLPPMLRSRVENRPNSSVTDFRRQLNKLQSTATPPRGTMRAMGRPLAQSPLQRPAAGGRPGHAHHRQAAVHTSPAAPARTRPGAGNSGSRPAEQRAPRTGATLRTHGDPTGGHDRPHRQTHMNRAESSAADPRGAVKRRRSNVLFLLVITTACTLFLAGTTSSTVLLYVFALSFLALCGYVYLLAQLRQRDAAGWNDGWLDSY
jgi:hypothetical protein